MHAPAVGLRRAALKPSLTPALQPSPSKTKTLRHRQELPPDFGGSLGEDPMAWIDAQIAAEAAERLAALPDGQRVDLVI
jgi:hypothetical protein